MPKLVFKHQFMTNLCLFGQEEYIKDEQRNLKKEYLHAQEEVKRIQSVPLVIGKIYSGVVYFDQ